MATYFYARVSTKEQNLARQIESAKQFRSDIDEIFGDKQTGKNFNRAEYEKMKKKLIPGDEIIVHELDRLGRNKEETKAEIKWFLDNSITVRILDIPTTLYDFGEQNWVREMITNILIEVLGSMAEQELKKNKKRQREGINAMPIVNGKRVSLKTGNAIGRPKKDIDIQKYAKMVRDGKITVVAACKELSISRQTWYRLVG